MKTAAALANKTYQNALTDRWEADFFSPRAAAAFKKSSKKAASRAVRHSEKKHIQDGY